MKVKGRDYKENKIQKYLWGKPKHFGSAYTQKHRKGKMDLKGCFGQCKFLKEGVS